MNPLSPLSKAWVLTLSGKSERQPDGISGMSKSIVKLLREKQDRCLLGQCKFSRSDPIIPKINPEVFIKLVVLIINNNCIILFPHNY